MKNYLFYLSLFIAAFSYSLYSSVPIVTSQNETMPIPMGEDTADDAALWYHPLNPTLSLILGTNKNKISEGGKGGLGVYNLEGQELNYYEVGRLNNVDVKYNVSNGPFCHTKKDIAVASNREHNALSFFEIRPETGEVTFIENIKLYENNVEMEPYGLCLYHSKISKKLYAILPQKSGKVYQYEVISLFQKLFLIPFQTIDLSKYVTDKQDEDIKSRVMKELIHDNEEDEYDEEMKERFQLEGCVSDEEYGVFYVGMERLGVWRIKGEAFFNPKPKLIAEVRKSKVDSDATEFSEGEPRLTDDIEGMDLYLREKGNGFLTVSVQGINEYALFDRKTLKYIGSFKIGEGSIDEVTKTDGLSILSSPLGKKYPYGILVVHDDENTDSFGNVENGNTKRTKECRFL